MEDLKNFTESIHSLSIILGMVFIYIYAPVIIITKGFYYGFTNIGSWMGIISLISSIIVLLVLIPTYLELFGRIKEEVA